MKRFIFQLLLLPFFGLNLYSQDCGTCLSPNCTSLTPYSDYNDADANYDAHSHTWFPDATGTVYTYSIVNSGPTGEIGIDLSHNSLPDGCVGNSDRTVKLFLLSSGSCNWASGITPTLTDGGNGCSWSNPEFSGLQINQDYIIVVQTVIPSGCSLKDQYLEYYQKTAAINCGTVGFDWKLGQTPTPSSPFNCSDNNDYSLKANITGSTAGDEGQYIAPGFTIYSDAGVFISNIQVKEGPANYFSIYPNKIVSYCVPSYTYLIKINRSGSGNITIKDNATAADKHYFFFK